MDLGLKPGDYGYKASQNEAQPDNKPEEEISINLFSMDTPKNERNISIDIEVIKGDITEREVDAIVNAAHEHLTGGGGVDGAIHAAAGQKLLGECLSLYGCPEGEVRITNGYDLPAKYIIHTVGPVWSQDKSKQTQLIRTLSNCYSNALSMAEMQGLKSIAFPCISTGAYAFPKDIAAQVAIHTIYKWFHHYMGHVSNKDGSYLDLVEIVCFTNKDVEHYKKAIADEEKSRTIQEGEEVLVPPSAEKDGCEDHNTCVDCQDENCEGRKQNE